MMAEIKAARELEGGSKESRVATPTGDGASNAGDGVSDAGDGASDAADSERSLTPDHLRWPTPEHL
jgi:hypothetical protein